MTKVIEDFHETIGKYKPEENITKPILTKYEKTKILGLRMEQLARNAPPYVDVDSKTFDPYKIALKELQEKKIPFMVRRTLPNGQKEVYRLEDMIIV
jgi:DNA-directed RNA polymerases I, II, and III subunit RPABC2